MTTVGSLQVQLLSIAVLSLQRQLYHNRGLSETIIQPAYDFVVVGGGTAGCIVASRLSANANVTVLLLEAGGPPTITSDILPAFYFFNYNWGYYTTPQKYSAFGIRDRRVFYPRGKILGGSHAINNALYSRGNPRGFDQWSTEYGAKGWSFREVFPFFLRSENNTDPEVVAANPAYHSTSGPVQISTPPNLDPLYNHWTNAITSSGWQKVDINVNQLGTTVVQATQSNLNWTRQTTYTSYIEPYITARANLHVLPESFVTKILFQTSLFEPKTIASGVKFERAGQTYQVKAQKEVIVSGGSINTPQLLMLSGIGPARHLAEHNISPVVADLPVGFNLQDHTTTNIYFLARNRSDITLSANVYTNLNAANLADFFVNNSGPLTRMILSETYVPTGVNGDKDWPDGLIYAIINQLPPDIDQVLAGYDQNNRDAWANYFRPLINNNLLFVLVFSAFRSVTRGRVRLASSDAHAFPLIDPNFFGDPQDLQTVVRTMSIALKVAESKYMSPYIRYAPVAVPGCSLCTDRPVSQCTAYLVCVARTMTSTSYHPVGTASMGNSTSARAVVDERLRVRKVGNLRVVDASVMPAVPNANTNAATMMVAEKAAQMLQEDHHI